MCGTPCIIRETGAGVERPAYRPRLVRSRSTCVETNLTDRSDVNHTLQRT